MKKQFLILLFAGMLLGGTAGVTLADDRDMDRSNSTTIPNELTNSEFDAIATSGENGE